LDTQSGQTKSSQERKTGSKGRKQKKSAPQLQGRGPIMKIKSGTQDTKQGKVAVNGAPASARTPKRERKGKS